MVNSLEIQIRFFNLHINTSNYKQESEINLLDLYTNSIVCLKKVP